MFGFGDHSVGARDSQSIPFPGYSLCFTHRKLDDLLREVLASCEALYRELHLEALDYRELFRLGFRLLAAKLLLDRGAPGDWDTSDARDVISAVERFYFGSGPVEPVVDDLEVQQLAWHKMRSSFLLQNVSVDALAYVYEHTLVDDLTRQSLGTHSTPREIPST